MAASATASIVLPSCLHGDQLRRRGEVVVPQVVVHDLVVPHALAGARVERDQAVRVEVAADAIGAVVVVGRRAGREVGDAAARVDRDLAPRVGAADVLPGVLGPRLVALLAGMRHRVERPHQLAGDDVEGAQRARAPTGTPSPGAEPSSSRFSKILPGVPDCTRPTSAGSRPRPSRRSTRPFLPKVEDRLAGARRRWPGGCC